MRSDGLRYVELQCASHFTFLRGASSCEELFAQAEACGLEALAITDRNSLAGIVRGYEAAKLTNVRLIVGCRLDLAEGDSLLVYPLDRNGYGLIHVSMRTPPGGFLRPPWLPREITGLQSVSTIAQILRASVGIPHP
ncbi:PHP domain-containing protein [Sphingobium sp. CR2-8]|uniref:PHP domain-containing protein n=1 Tax=Sphingobium sp. CR2-8 TaxID=1306534 RepID=UPI003FA37144